MGRAARGMGRAAGALDDRRLLELLGHPRLAGFTLLRISVALLRRRVFRHLPSKEKL